MPEYADIYSLHRTRDRSTIEAFIRHFMDGGEVATDEFVVPPHVQIPLHSFATVWDLIDYCCAHPQQDHWIPWRAMSGSRPEHACVNFLTDGSMVFGLSTDSVDQDFADHLCEQLAQMPGAVASYITHEDESPASAPDFIAFVQTLPIVDQSETRSSRARRLDATYTPQ